MADPWQTALGALDLLELKVSRYDYGSDVDGYTLRQQRLDDIAHAKTWVRANRGAWLT